MSQRGRLIRIDRMPRAQTSLLIDLMNANHLAEGQGEVEVKAFPAPIGNWCHYDC